MKSLNFAYPFFSAAHAERVLLFLHWSLLKYTIFHPIKPLIFSYMFFSTAKRTKSCRQQKIRGSAAPRAETDASRETAAGCARSGGALFCCGISDGVIRLLSIPGKAFILCLFQVGSPFFFCLYTRPPSLSVLCKVLPPQFPRGERSASYPFLYARFRTLAFPLIFKRRIPVRQFSRSEKNICVFLTTGLAERVLMNIKRQIPVRHLFRSKEKHTLFFEGLCGPMPRQIFMRTNINR